MQLTPKFLRAEHIRSVCGALEDANPDISTEQLMARVSDETGASIDEVIGALFGTDLEDDQNTTNSVSRDAS